MLAHGFWKEEGREPADEDVEEDEEDDEWRLALEGDEDIVG